MLESGAVVVTSSIRHTIQNLQRILDRRVASYFQDHMELYSLSGWTLGKFRERGFPLSAHADYNGLLSFAKEVNPRVAYVFTGNAKEFSTHLSEMGVNAVPLE